MSQATQSVTDLLRERHHQIRSMFDETLAASGAERAEVFDCLRACLAVHETVEQMLVHPLAEQVGAEAEYVVDQRVAEEKAATQTLAELERLGPNGEQFATKLTLFKQDVVAHAEAEERELFPLIEGGFTPDKLAALADEILVAEQMAPTHPHPHAPNSPVGLLITGPFVAMVDKVRDRLIAAKR